MSKPKTDRPRRPRLTKDAARGLRALADHYRGRMIATTEHRRVDAAERYLAASLAWFEWGRARRAKKAETKTP